jgi:hypothetical protein
MGLGMNSIAGAGTAAAVTGDAVVFFFDMIFFGAAQESSG